MFLPAGTIYAHGLRILVSLLLLPQQITGSGITIESNHAQFSGQTITFFLSAQSETEITGAALVHGVTSNTCLGNSQARREVVVKDGSQMELQWTWRLGDSGNLPPGTSIWWQWELRDASGVLLLTEPQTLTLEDRDLTWNTIQNGPVTILWSEGDQNFANQLEQITERSLQRLAEEAGLHSSGPIRLMVYPSAEAMRGSLTFVQEWAGGVAFPQYKVVMVGVAPDELIWAREVIPHELAHLITGERIYNCTGDELPTWLEEGLADYATGQPTGSVRDAILAALDTNRLPALTQLSDGFPVESRLADQAYKQSHLVVEYIIDTFGAESIAEVLEQVRQGSRPDTALREVYGLDTAGIDQSWRASLGFGEAPVPNFDVESQPAAAVSIPTLVLYRPAGSATETPAATPTYTPAPETAAPPTPSQTALPAAAPAAESPGAGRSVLLLGLGGLVGLGLAAVAAAVIIRRRKAGPL